ncbi:phage tail spike protein [Clostridium gasigenes]|uniref:phage tail spike protein n=1 Tax=Clostridium gasigenes TaxID=94869 RepID=UPI001C0D2C87|nr:phage tail spike protein [Clostridium gasigenes]MBU3109333.1 phage tail protein [Clostridium gasigenes]
MLQLYDLDKVKIKGLKNYKDYSIESDLSSGDKSLSFLYPVKESTEIVEECYIRTKKEEFVIKEIQDKGEWKSIKATLNVEDIEGHIFEHFDTTEKTIKECITLALVGTGWTIGTCNVTRRRTVRKTNSSSWEILQDAKKVYRAEFELDTLNKKINIFEKLGSDKGVYFINSLNLKTLDIQSNSYDFYTRIIAIGKNDIRVTLENFQYSKKVKTFLWKDEKYTDINSLREDALAKLNELSKPRKAYSASVIDLANMNLKYKNILSYSLGDTISLISKDKEIKEKQRIVKIVEYPQEPEKNTCEIANTTLRFEDLQKEFQETSNTVDNITTDNGTVDGNAINGISSKKIYDFEANVGKIVNLDAVNARIENLYVEKADVGSLNAAIINAGELNATKANITDLDAINVSIVNLNADKAEIKDLNVVNQKVNVIEGDTANFKVLLNGNLTSTNIQAGGINSDRLTIQNGFITNLMVKDLDVSKINAGTISTDKFAIKSADGGIEIVGATQQFKDKNNKVRIQMGKDTQGNFNFILRGEDGVTALIDHTGIKKDAIADDLIVKEMIGKDAIGEKQLDYSSFAEGFNKDTNTHTLKATHIKLDNQNQTLDMAFNTLKTEVQGIEIGGRNLLQDSNFELDTIKLISVNGAVNSKDIIIKNSGTTSFKTVAQTASSASGGAVACTGLIVGAKYIVSLWAYSTTTDTFQLRVSTPSWVIVAISYPKFVANTWTKLELPFIATETIQTVAILNGVANKPMTIYIDDIKVESGTKATGYTVAPEDIDGAINVVKEITTSNSTTIGIQQGQITTAIANTQIIKDWKTIFLRDDYNRTVQTVNSTVETIGKHTTLLDANTGAITNVKTDVTEVKKSLDGITTRVGSSETSIDGINKSVSTANSEIAQLKDSISLKVNETYVNTAKSQATTDANNYTIKQVYIINQKTAGIEISLEGITSKVTNLESIETSNRKVGSFRYIRDWLNGSNANPGNHWCELEVLVGATNIARGKVPTGSTGMTTPEVLTDGNISSAPYVSCGTGAWHWLQLDLGSERKDIDMIRTFHYWVDGRQYNHKLQISRDGVIWQDLYNSDVSGTYVETANGRSYIINESYTESRLKSAEQKITPDAIISTVTDTVTSAATNAKAASAADATLKANQALEQGLLTINPIFNSWGGTYANYPTGMTAWSGLVGTRETTLTRSGGNALRFNLTATDDGGANISGMFKPNIANSKYVTLELDFYVVTGDGSSGAGLLMDWYSMTPYRTQHTLAEMVDSPIVTGKWYSVAKVFKRPTDTLTGYASMGGYLMANYSTLGAKTTKDIVYDRLAVRVSSDSEIKAYESEETLDDMANDGKLTAVEKLAIKKEWDVIVAEKTINDAQATSFGIVTEKATYGTNYTNLSNYITPLLVSLTATSGIVGTTFRATFKNYYDARSLLLNAIASKTKSLADTAQGGVNSLVARVTTAEQKITAKAIISTVQSTIDKAEADAISSANGTASAIYATKSSVIQTDEEWRATFKSSGGYNLIKNGQFRRKALTGGDWWVWQNWVMVYNNFQSFSAHNTGIGVQNSTPNAGAFLSNRLEFEANTVYTFSATSRKESNVKWGNFAIEFKRADGVSTNSITSDGLVESFSFTTPADCVGGHLILNHGGSNSASGAYLIWLDNVQIVKGNTVLPWSPHPSEIYEGNTVIDGSGVTIKNGALKIQNNAGKEVFKADNNGNIIMEGSLSSSDGILRLNPSMGDSRIDNAGGILRLQYDKDSYASVTPHGMDFYNYNNKTSFSYTPEGHFRLIGSRDTGILKMLQGGGGDIQARNSFDNAYSRLQASAFVVSSKAEFKDNIEAPEDINFTKILMDTEIKKYNLKSEMELVDKMPTVILADGSKPTKADTKIGLILDDLTEDNKALLNPTNSEGVDLYAMCSILWKVAQGHQLNMEKLTKKVEQL